MRYWFARLALILAAAISLWACREKPSAPTPNPSAATRPGALSARSAFALAEAKARLWNNGARLTGILSGQDIDHSGLSSYWEFRFVNPPQSRKYVVVVDKGKVKSEAEAGLSGPVLLLPPDWMDSAEAYQKSAAAFISRHPDHAGYERGWLMCSTAETAPAYWIMLFRQPQHLPVGSMVDARTGDYLGELKH